MISSFRQKVQASTHWGKADPAEMPGMRSAQARKRRPITAHRLFSAFSALWFAALLGLGSLAISPDVLGALVTKIGLPALVPAAAPPLGSTARLLAALVLAAIGGGIGLGLGLRLQGQFTAAARPAEPAPAAAPVSGPVFANAAHDPASDIPKVRARDAHPDAPPRRPLVLTEAFAEPGSSLAAPLIEEAMVPAHPLLRSKPEPSQSADLMVDRDSLQPVYEPVGACALKPLDLGVLDLAGAEQAPADGPFAVPEPAMAPAAQPGPPQLLAATPQVPSGTTLARPSPAQILAGEPWSPVASAPLAGLGLVQLIERLALAIAARKAAREAGPPPSDGTPAEGSAADLIEAAGEEAPGGPFARPANVAPESCDTPLGAVREAIMRRLDATALRSGRPSGMPSELPSELPFEPGAGPAPFSRPQRPEAAVPPRCDHHHQADETAAAATPAPLATEEALRSALATLQRISVRR